VGRDLFYKPGGAPPSVIDDDKTAPTKNARPAGSSKTEASDSAAPAAAYKAAYFNRDISDVRAVNQATLRMRALRGASEATDLRKVVLPAPEQMRMPEADDLRGAAELMGAHRGFASTIEGLIGRLAAWLRSGGMTADRIRARQEQLAALMAQRRTAVGRMRRAAAGQAGRSPTLRRAFEDADADGAEADEGDALLEATGRQAGGLHRRIAKMLGLAPADSDEP
jgi:hypothetical protein